MGSDPTNFEGELREVRDKRYRDVIPEEPSSLNTGFLRWAYGLPSVNDRGAKMLLGYLLPLMVTIVFVETGVRFAIAIGDSLQWPPVMRIALAFLFVALALGSTYAIFRWVAIIALFIDDWINMRGRFNPRNED